MTTTVQHSRLKNPVQVAWGVLLLAFAIFCTIALFGLLAVHYFFFVSTVPMDATVAVARGGVGYTPLDFNERAVGDEPQLLNIGHIVKPNPQSQALVTFRDPYQDNRVVATLSLDDSNASITLRTAARPRFDWGDARFLIELERVQGDIEVFVADGYDSSNFLLLLETVPGASIRVSSSGQASVRIVNTRAEVTNYRGEVVMHDESLAAKSIPPGYIGRIQADQSVIEVFQNPLLNLVKNNTFTDVHRRVVDTVETISPLEWGCGNAAESTPNGNFTIAREEGRQALFLVRGGDAETHGETFCQQGGSPDAEDTSTWIDVRDYGYLALKTSFYINFQSLNRCGQQGSECPLMVRIDYMAPPLEEGGELRPLTFIYGFYAVNNLNLPQIDCTGVPNCIQPADWPYRCLSCAQEHILVREKRWYTYSTGNILSTLPDEQKPLYITRIRFYASGHQYDVRVSELSLFAGDTAAPAVAVVP